VRGMRSSLRIEAGVGAREDVDLRLLGLSPLGGGEPRHGRYTGTKALMLAVLDNGIQSYLSPVARLRAEAEQWVLSRQQRSPFSFTVVCETLGLEPDAVRTTLRRWRATSVSSYRAVGRRRQDVRRSGRLVASKHPRR
jgi:hypothetical protein